MPDEVVLQLPQMVLPGSSRPDDLLLHSARIPRRRRCHECPHEMCALTRLGRPEESGIRHRPRLNFQDLNIIAKENTHVSY